MKAFKAYDIRGEWGTDLNETIAYRIGSFLPDVLDTDTYLVGRDMRLSSPTLFDNLTEASPIVAKTSTSSAFPLHLWSIGRRPNTAMERPSKSRPHTIRSTTTD